MPAKAKKAPAPQPNVPKPAPTNSTAKATPPAPGVAKKTEISGSPTASTNGTQSPLLPEHAAKDTDPSSSTAGATSQVNRKKQKRREKEAAKRAAEQQLSNGYSGDHASVNGQSPYSTQSRGPPRGYFSEDAEYVHPEFADDAGDLDDRFFSGEDDPSYPRDVAANHEAWAQGQSARKKRKDAGSHHGHNAAPLSRLPAPPLRSQLVHPPTLSNAAFRSAHRMSGESIWNTSTQAERENIKQFWLELGEEERRSLVKVEKEAVLRKMKEQQKHSCSCSVCGRKRTAIEEELEVLYDAYYEELEQFANHNNDLTNAPQLMAPPQSYRQLRAPPMAGSYPQRGRVHEIGEDDEGLEDDEEYDDDEEGYSDDDVDGQPPGGNDFYTFGNSLTVKDGILTVADDLLKNDGKHFIDMMEQLAERRMQREEEIHYPSAALAHQTVHQGHNHPPLSEDDDYDDDEDDEDYDSQEDEDFEGDEMDSMTEEQRMEEGRRMFQIFAARMFEQRVLTAYREKVARERQQKLLEELDEESRLDTQREAKKAKEAAKKKEKKRLQKLAKDEEKAKREAEKAAEEAAAREVEERKLEEQRQRKEEQRKKRDAEKKAAEEERLRKESEKQRRAQEEREKQAEIERKQKEAREREKKKRDEVRKKEREDREAKEKESRERKAKEEDERKAKEEQTKKERDGVAKAEREARDRTRQEQAMRRQPVALPPGLYPPSNPSHLQSPHFQVVTPILPPKAPTPNRNRQPSQPGQSHGSSPRSQPANTDNSRSSGSPATIAVPQTPGATHVQAKTQGQPPMLHHPQPSAPLSPLSSQGRAGQPPFGLNGMAGLGMNGIPLSGSGVMPGMAPQMPIYQGPPMGGQQRFGPPQGISYPPGFPGPRHFPGNQPPPFHSQAPVPVQISAPANSGPKLQSHSRQVSDSNPDPVGQPAPIARPAPIGRPSSTTPDKQRGKRQSADVEVDHLATQLGSKALLEDSDPPFAASLESKASLPPLGAPGSGRLPFSNNFSEPKHDSFGLPGQGWSGFSPSLSSASGGWGAPGPTSRPGGGWPQSNNNAFGTIGGGMPGMPRSHAPRPIAIRRLVVDACKHLSPGMGPDGFVPIQTVLREVEMTKAPTEPPISMDDMLEICDTEGNAQNGGGSFSFRLEAARGRCIKFEAEAGTIGRSSVGDIGSPISQHSQPAPFGGVGQGFGPPGRGF